MYSELEEFELESVQKELTKVNKDILELKNEEYNLSNKKNQLLKEKCKENIGRCFKKLKNGKVISYCKIINIDEPTYEVNSREIFNEYQYPSISFKYPYDGSKMPFYEKDLFSGAWEKGNDHIGILNKITYEEISKMEFFEKFNEVNLEWINKLKDC